MSIVIPSRGGVSRSNKIIFKKTSCVDINRFCNFNYPLNSDGYAVKEDFLLPSVYPFCDKFLNYYGVSLDSVYFVNYAINLCFFKYEHIEEYINLNYGYNVVIPSFIPIVFYNSPRFNTGWIYDYLLNPYCYFGLFDNDGFFPCYDYRSGITLHSWQYSFYFKNFVKRLYVLNYRLVNSNGIMYCFGKNKSLFSFEDNYFFILKDYTFDVYLNRSFYGNYDYNDFVLLLESLDKYAIGAYEESLNYNGSGLIFEYIDNSCICRELNSMNKILGENL